MQKLSKLSFLFSGISLVCLLLARLAYGGWHNLFWIPLAFFLVFLVLPLAKERRTFGSFFAMKTTKKGLSMGTMILLVLAALILVNIIAVRKYKTWDFSSAKGNTLADQSLRLVHGLDAPLKVTFFYKKGAEGNDENRRAFRELIKKYQDQTDKIALDFVEVNERPDLANEYGVTKGSGVVFLDYKGRRGRIEKIEEQEVTNALVKVTREKDKTVYFVVGHGEMDLDDAKEQNGLGSLKTLLTSNRYAVKTLPLSQTPKIPADADVVAIVGPTQNYTENAIGALEDYLKHGGQVLLALESKKTEGLEKVLARVGIQPLNNYIFNVVETAMGVGVQQGPTIATNFSTENEITKVFTQNEFVIFHQPMALRKEKVPPGIAIDDFVKSQDGSMAFETLNIKTEGPKGSYTLGQSVTGRWPGADEKAPEFHLVVFGDAEFLGNMLLYQNLNRDLALNTIASLAKEASVIAITPKEASMTKMVLTDTKLSLFVWAFAIPLPLLLLAAAIALWTRRRFA